MTSNKLTNDLLLALSSRFPIRVWRHNVGAAIGANGRLVRYGRPGEADITGILRVRPRVGIRVEIEIKVGKDRQNEAQKVFERMITSFGGIYLIAKDVGSTLAELEKAMAEIG